MSLPRRGRAGKVDAPEGGSQDPVPNKRGVGPEKQIPRCKPLRDDRPLLPAAADVEAGSLKPHRDRRKGLKPSTVLIEQQRRMFEPETTVTVWRRR